MEAWFVSDGKSLWWIENKALMLEWKSVTLAPETVIKVVLVVDGIEGCHVGFLPRHIALRPAEVNRFHLQFAQVVELYDDCEVGTYQRTKSARNNGMAAFVLLNNVRHYAN